AAIEPPRSDPLQDYRERVAARWCALKEVFEQGVNELPPAPARPTGELGIPLLAVFSVAGGAGKKSLVATLGRVLASAGEKSTLVDTTSHGLLPLYYGARELRPGLVRSFSQAEGGGEAVSMLVAVASFQYHRQLDAALPLHLDVREVFRRKLGARLLQFTIRQSPAVSEALAEGMTVMDYAPSDPVARDYMDVASWLREHSPLAKTERSGLRWGEK